MKPILRFFRKLGLRRKIKTSSVDPYGAVNDNQEPVKKSPAPPLDGVSGFGGRQPDHYPLRYS
jgi:hypothetical protein